ncbi:MAG TPA: F0F1 ATP synthase subunit B [Gemmatimonadales bacterium]
MTPMLLALAVAQGGEGAASPFSVEPGLIIWTWVVFIALFLLLRRFAWPVILKTTEEREQRIRGQLEEAERLSTEAKAALEEHRALLAGARQESHQLLQDAKSAAGKEREALLARTREEQEQLLDRATKEISAERERALAELRREAVDLSLAAASKLIGARLDAAGDRKLVEQYLASLGDQH